MPRMARAMFNVRRLIVLSQKNIGYTILSNGNQTGDPFLVTLQQLLFTWEQVKVSSATVIRHNPLQDYINMPFERFYPDESDDDI